MNKSNKFIGSQSFYLGGFVIVCVLIFISIVLLPKHNYFLKLNDYYPTLYTALHKDTVNFNNILTDLNCKLTTSNNTTLEWNSYFNKEHCKNTVYILPLFSYGKLYSNSKDFLTLLEIINNQPNILGIYFWKFPPQSAFINRKEDNSDIFRYTLCLNNKEYDEKLSSLWVNGEIKQLTSGQYCLWNPNYIYSLHNNTNSEIIYLNIDLYNSTKK